MLVIGRLFAASFGFLVAVVAAAVFLLAASVGTRPESAASADWFWALFTVSSFVTASAVGAFVAAPAAVLILVCELFAIRSWIVYAAAGG
ncbi:hypothetical protein [Methylobrevis pamukkalensis]|uniref:Uncharacterized protein n=1 Tax=Methylobrevis pamukkalensis TaxID=1439726 RepID=A0A1E3H1V6_9HYPH|nr:hypothetical protein [Methylobrevis pamukkalensis]ODN70297.1 hypothetical protein A6302_02389 [Methylobrevis pamukkalensis]